MDLVSLCIRPEVILQTWNKTCYKSGSQYSLIWLILAHHNENTCQRMQNQLDLKSYKLYIIFHRKPAHNSNLTKGTKYPHFIHVRIKLMKFTEGLFFLHTPSTRKSIFHHCFTNKNFGWIINQTHTLRNTV